jgi:hypothetical protein
MQTMSFNMGTLDASFNNIGIWSEVEKTTVRCECRILQDAQRRILCQKEQRITCTLEANHQKRNKGNK